MGDAVGDHFDGEPLHCGDGSVTCSAVGHHSRSAWNLGDPTSAVLTIELDGQLQGIIIAGCGDRRRRVVEAWIEDCI